MIQVNILNVLLLIIGLIIIRDLISKMYSEKEWNPVIGFFTLIVFIVYISAWIYYFVVLKHNIIIT